MPVKKVSATATMPPSSAAAAPARPRKRTSLSLNGATNSSETTPAPGAASAAAASTPTKKAGMRTRTAVASTSIAAQQVGLASAAAPPVPAPPPTSNAAASGPSSATAAASAPRACAGASHSDPHAPAASASTTTAGTASNTNIHGSSSSIGSTQHPVSATAPSSSSSKTTFNTTATTKAAKTTPSASKPRACTTVQQPVVTPGSEPPPVAPSPNLHGAPHHAGGNTNSTNASPSAAAPAMRRQRGSIGATTTPATTAAPAGSGSAAPFTNASPVPMLRATKHAGSAMSAPPPQPVAVASADPVKPAKVHPMHSGSSGGGGASAAATASTRLRRTSATANGVAHTIKDAGAAPVGAAVGTPPLLQPPEIVTSATSTSSAAAESKRDERGHSRTAAPLPPRKRAGATTSGSTSLSTKAKPSAGDTTATAETAPHSSATAAAHSFVDRSTRKVVVRRSSDDGTTTAAAAAAASSRPSNALASRRSSARGSVSSVPTTAASTAPPTRDPSIAQPQLQSHSHANASNTNATAAGTTAVPPLALETESFTSTALNTARESVSELESSVPNTTFITSQSNTVAPMSGFSSLPRRSHGPVISEEWTRSIIKPGDEQLLYAPANVAFVRTPSGTAVKGARGAASITRKSSKGRSSPYDPELRRAQETVLQQRHIATPTPGRRSTRGAATGASVAASAASGGGGSGSRLGSTVKRSGTRLQQLRHEAEERQRSLNATLSTPNNEEGSALRAHGSTADPGTGGPHSASPTPSRMSEASFNTGAGGGGGGRHSVGTPLSRRSTGSNEVPIESIPGAASIVGGTFRHTPPGAASQHPSQQQQPLQRGSPSLALFARPSPRIFATPSPRGSTSGSGVPGLMVTFGVNNNAPYYTGNEELTKLTRVREDMLRALLLSSTAAKAKDESGSASTPLSNSASSPHADTATAATSGGTSPSAAAHRPRQRIYGVDIRPGANGEITVSPQKAPAADVSKPRGRASSNTAEAILVSSMRQKPSGAAVAAGNGGTAQLSPALSPAAAARSGNAGGGSAAGTGATTRPKLSSTALGSTTDATFSATDSAMRLPRRSAVTVALANLQPVNALGERVRAELVRQSEQSQKVPAPRAGSKTAVTATATAAAVAPALPRSAPISFEEATRRLLLDPFFPLVSEENYQRLVLQNDEYNERKALIVRIYATPPPKPSPTMQRGDDDGGQQSRRSGTVGPRAARALEMDLAEADEMPVVVAPLTTLVDTTAAASLTTPSLPACFSFAATSPVSATKAVGSGSSNINNNSFGTVGSGAAPRRPSVQYGGPTVHPSPTQSRARSPSPGAPSTSPPLVASLNSPSTSSPARENKLLVNAVMPSEKTGPIKPLALSGVGYTPSVSAGEAAQSGGLQTASSPSNLNNGPGTPVSNSPHRAYSRSPSASRSSSRHTTRRSSLFHGAQQNMSSAAPASQSVSSDSESTASDEAVDQAEAALRRVLPRWGPFRTVASNQPPASRGAAGAASVTSSVSSRPHHNSNSTSTTSVSSTHSAGRKGKKTGDTKARSAVMVETASPPPPSSSVAATVLPPAMLDELEAYVHVFLKRFRDVDVATAAEIGEAPETPLALQRAIRQSLRLSCDSVVKGSGGGGAATEDVDGVSTELQDPLDDGSYHSQNVQYVLDLLGSLLQLQDAFCEDVVGGRAASRVARDTKRSKAKLTEADFLATVMWHPPLDKSGQYDTDDDVLQKAGVGSNVTRTVRKSRARPLLKLRNPELHAVELMFARHGSAVADEKN
jgi:hypothetical protein